MFTRITASDGHELDCWIQPAQGARKAGIVVLQEIFGVTDQLKNVARMYAGHGYEVAIPALFDRQERAAVIPFGDAPRGRDLMMACELDAVLMDAAAAGAALRANGGKVGALGFCWGGGLAIRMAQGEDVDAAAAFYGTRLPSYMTAPLRVPVLAHFGAEDSHVPPEMLAEVKAFWPEMETQVYAGAGHAFANEARPADYVAEAAQIAHRSTLEFFERHLS